MSVRLTYLYNVVSEQFTEDNITDHLEAKSHIMRTKGVFNNNDQYFAEHEVCSDKNWTAWQSFAIITEFQ